MPALNLAAKDTVNAIPSDELLFGTSFGDRIKKVAAMQKSFKEIIRIPFGKGPSRCAPPEDGIQEARSEHKSPSLLSQVPLEVEETLVNTEVIVGGRLALFRSQWEIITSDPRILQAISGYRLPLIRQPPSQAREPSVFLSCFEEQRCSQEIARLLTKGAIEPTVDCEGQYLSSFFLIEKPSGGWRSILNPKDLNRFICAPHFKMEDWKTVIRLISPGDYLASIDLEDAYLRVPVHQNDRKFLSFRFLGHLYQFRVLPFGLASAPYICTKILRPVAYFLRVKSFGGDFKAQMSLPSSIREDLHWWKNIFADKSQENPIRSGLFALEIFSDASLTGWGAVCSNRRSHGFWSPEEKQFHINYLELLAVFHALRCFAAHLSNSSVLLRTGISSSMLHIFPQPKIARQTLSLG
ncbi:uncharacterized protein [Linepithema humile]|uniref:uncharacterized protein n=1 Tax=Linepithema humile TaxID=83485 RepID=UPI00351EFEAD